MKPDATLPALSDAEERLLAEAGFTADPARPGHWLDTRGRGRSVTTSVALRRARADLPVAETRIGGAG